MNFQEQKIFDSITHLVCNAALMKEQSTTQLGISLNDQWKKGYAVLIQPMTQIAKAARKKKKKIEHLDQVDSGED